MLLNSVGEVGLINNSRLAGSSGSTLFQQAATELRGPIPNYWFDFTRDRAIFNNVDVDTITAGVTLTSGTLALSSNGHAISSAANVLDIPITLAHPFTYYIEFVRTVDSGANARVITIDDGTTAEYTTVYISSTDAIRVEKYTASVIQLSYGSGITDTLNTIHKAAVRIESNNSQYSVNGTTPSADTSVTIGANPTRLLIGNSPAATALFTGYIRKVGIFTSSLTASQIQKMTP
jgi:hypothetical protein